MSDVMSVCSCSLSALLVVLLATRLTHSQRRIVGDISEQKISQLADFDAREERVYR